MDHEETIFHPHGFHALPNAADGVPYLTSLPIAARHATTLSIPLAKTLTGTHFLHGHIHWQGSLGAVIPIIITNDIPDDYRLTDGSDDLNQAQDIVMILEVK